jgi:toxin-antitoxin system PIN domain toxin
VLLLDVNVLVDAFRADVSRHEAVRRWLELARNDHEAVGLLPEVALSFVRITTNRRIWRIPSTSAAALEFVAALVDSPSVRWHRPGDRQWLIFLDFVKDLNLSGDDIPDAYLAATSMEAGASLVTADRGFSRFRSLKVIDPVIARD